MLEETLKKSKSEKQSELYDLQSKVKECQEKISKHYAENKAAAKQKQLKDKYAEVRDLKITSWIIAEVITFVAMLIIESFWDSSILIYIQLAGLAIPIVLFVIFTVLKLIESGKIKQEIEAMDAGLREFHAIVGPIESEKENYNKRIRSIEREISEINEKIKYCEIDSKYKNHVLVYVGEKSVCNYTEYKLMRNRIEIDGVDYGFVENKPFKAIYLNPGVHTIKVSVQSGDDIYTSNVQQFVVDNNCNYFEFESMWARGFKINKFNNAADFFKSTGFHA